MDFKDEIVFYRPDNAVQLEVRVQEDTVWLSLSQIGELFSRDKSVISRHIKNVFAEEELFTNSTVANFATVQMEGGKTVERHIEYYNLDVIISEQLRLDVLKHHTQYPEIAVNVHKNCHDRFLVIDDVVYHIGASIKDLGKKLFAFSKMEICARELLNNFGQTINL